MILLNYEHVKTIKIYNESKIIKTYEHEDKIYCVIKISEYEIASGSNDGLIKIWDNYVSHNWRCTSIYHPLSYPL